MNAQKNNKGKNRKKKMKRCRNFKKISLGSNKTKVRRSKA